MSTDSSLTQQLIAGDTNAFEIAFSKWYTPLVNFAKGILNDQALAEEQVQEVYIRLWEKREFLNPSLPIFPYLLKSVRNRCLNALEHQKVERKYVTHTQRQYQSEILNYDFDEVSEDLLEKLHEAIQELPEKCREVFKLSRFEGLSHREIHDKLHISTKTIENHITKALKILKDKLSNNITILMSMIAVPIF